MPLDDLSKSAPRISLVLQTLGLQISTVSQQAAQMHELGMVYAALEEARGGNPLDGQNHVISDWLERFPGLPVVLTDTFTTDVTLERMSRQQIDAVKSFRIDSGDEFAVGAKIVRFLKSHGIDPMTRTLFLAIASHPKKHLRFIRILQESSIPRLESVETLSTIWGLTLRTIYLA